MKISKNQLKEYVRRIVRQQLKEQNFPKENQESKVVSEIDKWLLANENKFYQQMQEVAYKLLLGNEGWMPTEKEAQEELLNFFKDEWYENFADHLSDLGGEDLVNVLESSLQVKKAFKKAILDLAAGASDAFVFAEEDIRDSKLDPYELRGLSRKDFMA